MKRFNITTQGSYSKNGVEKKTYPQVGKLIQFDDTVEKEGGFLIELNMFPNTKFYVFEDNKETKTEVKEEAVINIQDEGDGIPF